MQLFTRRPQNHSHYYRSTPPIQDSNHHEDYYISRIGNAETKPLFTTGILGWGHPSHFFVFFQVPWAALAALDDFRTPLGGLWASRHEESYEPKNVGCFFRFFSAGFRGSVIEDWSFFGRCRTGNCQLLHFFFRAFQDVYSSPFVAEGWGIPTDSSNFL